VDIYLSPTDRVVLEHEVPNYDERGSMFTRFVTVEDNDDCVVVWRVVESKFDSSSWRLAWKGTWEGTMKFFVGLIEDLEQEYQDKKRKGNTDAKANAERPLTALEVFDELADNTYGAMYAPVRNAVFAAAVGLPYGSVHVFEQAPDTELNKCAVCEDRLTATCHVEPDETLVQYTERQGGEGSRR
jgi:hypothetical protein